MNHLQVSHLGPIKEADIHFGDLTLLVGPQASGKSILLQLVKLLADKSDIRSIVEQYGFTWGVAKGPILNRYFGEDMNGVWNDETRIEFDNQKLTSKFLLPLEEETPNLNREQSTFYIPAHRVLCFQNGWPRFFTDYDDSTPFVVREFSETLRLYVESKMSTRLNFIYSFNTGLNEKIKTSFSDTIFSNSKIELDTTGRKRFKLEVENSSLPYTVWSAGQKEFMPLLLSFFYLCTSGENKNPAIKTVIIEEPEMGLHPQAIQSVMLQILDLMHRGYQVIVSTHSPVLLELLWAINYIQKDKGTPTDLFDLFSIQPDHSVEAIFKEVIASKKFATYFFDKTKDGVIVKNISTLDAGSDDPAVASWGGLTDFASRAGDVVSKLVANEE